MNILKHNLFQMISYALYRNILKEEEILQILDDVQRSLRRER